MGRLQNNDVEEASMHMFGGFSEMGYGGHLFGAFFMILFWVAVIVLVVFLVKKLMASTSSPDETPLDILKKRYANGDITEEEFVKMRKELE